MTKKRDNRPRDIIIEELRIKLKNRKDTVREMYKKIHNTDNNRAQELFFNIINTRSDFNDTNLDDLETPEKNFVFELKGVEPTKYKLLFN